VIEADLARSAARMQEAGADEMVTNFKDAAAAIHAAASAPETEVRPERPTRQDSLAAVGS
jgi:hypothetical protein